MDNNPISHEEPSCSHGPVALINNATDLNEDECILRQQAGNTFSKKIYYHKNSQNEMRTFINTDELNVKYTSEEYVELNNNRSNTSKEITVHEPQTESTTLIKPNSNEPSVIIELPSPLLNRFSKTPPREHPHFPLILISRPQSFVAERKPADPLTIQPQPKTTMSASDTVRAKMPNPNPEIHLSTAMPPSLFIQALSRINQSNLSVTLISQLQDVKNSTDERNRNIILSQREISAPNSITESAPPSYSFVLRQNSRRPQLMGTFIPSPSFIPLTPPPNYATAFDIYVDNEVPPPRPTTINYGFTPMPVVCPICGVAGITVTRSKITLCTHLCAVLMCLFCCWLCVPLPYLLNSCKDVYHYCGNCRNLLGMYCPTNPDTTSSFA